MKTTTFGLDLAKRLFQLHWVDMETGEIGRRQLKRGQVLEFFANRGALGDCDGSLRQCALLGAQAHRAGA